MDAPLGLKRLHRRSVIAAATTAVFANAVAGQTAAAETYPTRPIRVIVPTGAGTVSDIVARLLAQRLPKALGQNVVVENVSGAGGMIGSDQLVRAPNDGHTLALVNNNHAINPSIYKRVPYDTLTDITPISLVGTTPLVLVANPKLPANNLAELLSLARTKPGMLTYGSAGNGSAVHLTAVLLTSIGGVDIRHVPYKAVGQAVTDLLAGHIDMLFVAVAVAAEYVEAGRLRALGVTTTARSELLPEVPTLAEAGLPGYDLTGWMVLVGPRNLPRPIVDRLNAELKAALAFPDVRHLLSRNSIVPATSTPEQAADFLKRELDKHSLLAKRAGIMPN